MAVYRIDENFWILITSGANIKQNHGYTEETHQAASMQVDLLLSELTGQCDPTTMAQ